MSENLKLISSQIKLLRKEIIEHEKKYYSAEKTVEDEIYDFKLSKLIDLEKQYPQFKDKNSPTQNVGSDKEKNLLKLKHSLPMLSLNNSFNEEELAAFFKSIEKNQENYEYFLEPKVDGVSISLVYENNELKKAISRGDGIEGEDLTEKIKKIDFVPTKVLNGPNNFIVRGEIFVEKQDFEIIKEEMIQDNEKNVFSNHRSYVGGTLRLKKFENIKDKKLKIITYFLHSQSLLNNGEIKTQAEVIKKLKEWGFPTHEENSILLSSDKEKIIEHLQKFKDFKESWKVPTDGVVIKINEMHLYEEIGFTSKFPKWAIAYKFPSLIKNTKLLGISHTVGRSGRITYLGELEKVEINGSIVNFATLHNFENIKELDLRVGDTVRVYKSGEIIPKILDYVYTKEHDSLPSFLQFDFCPSCNSRLEIKNKRLQFCMNDDCYEKKIAKMTHFVSREAMNIEGLSLQIIKKLRKLGLLKEITDIYELKNQKEKVIEANINIKEKLFNNLVSAIEKSKEISQDKVLFALGIEHVGARTAKLLIKFFLNIEKIFSANYEDIASVYSVGGVCATEIKNWISKEENKKLIENLKQLNVIKNDKPLHLKEESYLLNKSVVITGSFYKERSKLIEILENKYGAKIKSSISKNIDYLILGNNPGSKYEQSKKHNIKVIDEKKLLKDFKI